MEKSHTDLQFFYGSSNTQLGEKITTELKLSKGKLLLKKFANDETYAQFEENIRGKDIFLMQTAVAPINDYLVELLIMIDAAKRSSAGRITVITPNYFYARQDRKSASRESITARLVADLITTAGADRIITLDLHSDQTQGFFSIPLDNLPTTQLFIAEARKLTNSQSVVVAPDAGSAKEATKIATTMNLELAIINKVRVAHNTAHARDIIGADVKGKNCFLFDDIIDTGGSLCRAAEILKQNGAAHIYVFATHGIFSGNAITNLTTSPIEHIYVTDTIPLKQPHPHISVISIAPYLADAIRCLTNDKSVSELFSKEY